MDVPQETQEKIARLQMLEQNIQSFAQQRQQFQLQLSEIDQALKELGTTKEKPYKVVGNLMVETDAASLKKDLEGKKEMIDVRVKSLEKQEKQLRDKGESLQKEVLKVIQEKKGE